MRPPTAETEAAVTSYVHERLDEAESAARVTVRHLLSMRSGLYDFDDDETRALVEADGRVAIHCAEWDAISDVKRALEARFSEAWDLVGRPRDRDGCFAGWELVSGETPLGPHFFVGDYGLKRGDVVHAVVRRRG